VELPGSRGPAGDFSASSFSPDGKRVAGYKVTKAGRSAGVAVYDLSSRALTGLTTDDGAGVRWLDNRRVIYFTKGGSQLVVVDTVTRLRTVVPVTLPAPSTDDVFAVSRDGRTIYYGAARSESDIWIAERR
jgi:Tol biopolymer transport system component